MLRNRYGYDRSESRSKYHCVLYHAILTAGGVFLATAVLLPLDRRYRTWKASRAEVTLRRDWRGRLVPDLTGRRVERTLLLVLAAVFAFGLAAAFTVMS